MGSGVWSSDVYAEREVSRKARGESAFAHDEAVKKTGSLKVHPSLNPYGVRFRESRDSAEHPTSNAVVVCFDTTGSMGGIPRTLRESLPQLLGLLLYKNYIPNPQILFGAIGDVTSDRVPLQVGQFESDNRMDEHLQNLVLEGGGGTYGMESYEMALYFMARHTATDCYEKRHKKGYFFMIGDEMAYPAVKHKEVRDIVDGPVQESIPLEQIVKEAQERYNVYFIIPAGASGGSRENIYEFWKNLLGQQHVLRLDNPADIAQTIALVIGTSEGTIGLDDGIEDLREVGADSSTIEGVKKALAVLPNTGAIVKGSDSLSSLTPSDDADDKKPKSRRL